MNAEGYPDPTADKAIKRADKAPEQVSELIQNDQGRGSSGRLRHNEQDPPEGSENGEEIHMIGYLSGPVTGNPDYKKQFAWSAKQLTRMGYDVINPAALSQVVPIVELSYDTIMEIDMLLLSKADYLIQLPGWETAEAPTGSWATPWPPTRSWSRWSIC